MSKPLSIFILLAVMAAPLTGPAFAQDTMQKPDTAMSHDAMKPNTMSKGMMKHDTMAPSGMSKTTMSHDAMKPNTMATPKS